METIQIDRTKLQPIINEALANSRRIDLSKISKEDWLAIRNILGLGASDVSAALGINKFKTAYQLWQEKVAEEVTPIQNKFMRAGLLLEDAIITAYEEDCNKKVIRPKELVIHPKYDCLFATPDGIIQDEIQGNGIFQAKSTSKNVYESWKEEETGTQSIPLMYYCQVQMEMECCDLNWAILALFLTDTRDFVYVPIKRDKEFIDKLVLFLVNWWEKFIWQNEAPPMTSYEFDHIDPIPGSVVEADEDTLKLVELCQVKLKEEKHIKDEIESLKNKIKEAMGEAEILTSGGNKIATYKTIKREAYEVKASSYRQLKFIKTK